MSQPLVLEQDSINTLTELKDKAALPDWRRPIASLREIAERIRTNRPVSKAMLKHLTVKVQGYFVTFTHDELQEGLWFRVISISRNGQLPSVQDAQTLAQPFGFPVDFATATDLLVGVEILLDGGRAIKVAQRLEEELNPT